ncbi:MAG: DUF4922 domain-containing protein [Bacteroidota bacterium]
MIINNKPSKSINNESLAEKAKKLLDEQKFNWVLLKENYEKLDSVRIKSFHFGNYEVKIQFNPARIISTGADVSDEAINNRKCFLCRENLPEEQTALAYDKKYIILCNPYPILDEHFTIPTVKHTPQSITNSFDELLDLGGDLGKYYSVVYNGPKCGASAPDHMHFQAVTKNVIPIEIEFDNLKQKNFARIISDQKIEIYLAENYSRYAVVFESGNKGELLYAFKILLKALRNIFPEENEPMLNIICTRAEKDWRVFIFPRYKHRPNQFFLNDDRKLLISPAAVDMGGLIICPDEEDFNKITKEDAADIYKQVSFTKEYAEYIKKKLLEAY